MSKQNNKINNTKTKFLIRAPTRSILKAENGLYNKRKIFHVGKFSNNTNIPNTLITEDTRVLPPYNIQQTNSKEENEELLNKYKQNMTEKKARALLLKKRLAQKQRETKKLSALKTPPIQHEITSNSIHWRIEDPQSGKIYEGTTSVDANDSTYALLILKGTEFTYVPTDLIQYRSAVTHDTLTLDEAEEKMKTMQHRWLMRQRQSNLANTIAKSESDNMSTHLTNALKEASKMEAQRRFVELNTTSTTTNATTIRSKKTKVKKEKRVRNMDDDEKDDLTKHRNKAMDGIANIGNDDDITGLDFKETFDDDDDAVDEIAADLPSDKDDDDVEQLPDELKEIGDEINDNNSKRNKQKSVKTLLEQSKHAAEDAESESDDSDSNDDSDEMDIDDDVSVEEENDDDDDDDDEEEQEEEEEEKKNELDRKNRTRSSRSKRSRSDNTTNVDVKRVKTEKQLSERLVRSLFKEQKKWKTTALASKIAELGFDTTKKSIQDQFLALCKKLCYFDHQKNLWLK